MRTSFRAIKFLATTAMSTAILPVTLLGAGVVAKSTTHALAGPDADTIEIPLYHLKDQERLGILIGTNGGAPKMYMFDTGSDQFNGQLYPKNSLQNDGDKTVYAYGNGTYAYHLQPVKVNSLTYYGDEGTVAYDDRRSQIAGKIEDHIYTENYKPLPGEKIDLDKNNPIIVDKTTYYADLNARAKIRGGDSAELDTTFGIFGAGDFLMSDSANSSAIGGLTRSGYIVSANANVKNTATPGCAPCTIVNLNPSLRAQFDTFVPWQVKHGKDYRRVFPGSGAHASTQYEGNYTYTFKFTVDGKPETVRVNDAPALFDTGTPDFVYLSQEGIVDLLKDNKLVLTKNGTTRIDSFSIQPDGQPGASFTFDEVDIARLSDEDPGNGLILGLPFFYDNAVVYDLENKATGYSYYFVSADDFTTDAGTNDLAHLAKVTPQMGHDGWFGLAGVIFGSGDLTLEPKTNVRLTGANTYTGATYISRGASLSLVGPGSIENSVRVVSNGTLDIQQKGNFQNEWGVSSAYNDARIRSLAGTGNVLLLERTLVLTDAKDTFSGEISDVGADGKHYGGGLSIIGGAQTLSGKNVYTGATSIGTGATLLLSQTGSLASPVTTSGLFANDGMAAAQTTVERDGIVAGSGIFAGFTVATGGTVAPGSVLDPTKAVSALTVSGDFSQQAGSTYQAGLASTSDLIDVAGSAAIDGGAQFELLRQGTPSIDTRYTLLTAAGGVDGTYGGLTGAWVADTPFVDFSLAYDPQNVFLDTERTATAFADVGTTFNQRSVGAASEALGAGSPIHDNILFVTTSETRNAFDQLSGEIHSSVHSTLVQNSHFVRDAAGERIRAAFDGVGAWSVPVMAYGPDGAEMARPTSERFAVWGSGFGAWGHLDGDGNAAKLDHSTGGFLAGGDTLVGGHWRLGLLAGYSHTSFDVDERVSSGSSNNYHLGLYAGTQRGPLGFRSGLAYTWHRIETNRSVAFPGFSDGLSADYDAGTFQAFGELGYRLDTASASFEPYANLAYVKFDADGFSEDGGAAALSSGDQSSDTTFTTLGLRASSNFMLGSMAATVRGGIGWQHAFGDVTPETNLAFAGGPSFSVKGTPIAENAAVIEAGLDMNLTETATLGLAYQGQIASDAQEHGFNGKLSVRF